MLVTLPTPDPGPESDTENPAHKEPGGLCEDPIAIRLRPGSDAHVEHHGVIADNPGGGSVAGSSFDTPWQPCRRRLGSRLGPGGVITSAHFGGVNWPLAHLGLHTGVTLYVGLLALGVNLTVTVVGTLVCHWFGVREGEDVTSDADYLADEGDPNIRRMAELIDGPQRYEPRHAR